MQIMQLILQNFFSFVLIISVIVFIHEFGHFYVARLCGVKVDVFAIGFGKELWGFNDKKGTRWKLCLLPFGGYVKMYGDRNAASMPDAEVIAAMSQEEKKQSFVAKNVYQRMAVVVAGPVANFIFTIFLFTILFKINGVNTVLPIVDEVLENSAAMSAGLKKGDEILEINQTEIKDFESVRELVVNNLGQELSFKIKRQDKILDVAIMPKIQARKDFFGDEVKVATLGVSAATTSHQDLNLGQSFVRANQETLHISGMILKTLGELITGQRSVKELGGPVKIAQYSGKTVMMGVTAILWFMAMISLNLGVMNLLPIPALDGGHLFYYIIEAIRGKDLSQKAQQYGFQVGMAMLLALMMFTTFNDVRNLFN
jgi:regulator of sigma E protease